MNRLKAPGPHGCEDPENREPACILHKSAGRRLPHKFPLGNPLPATQGPWSLELYGGAWIYTDNDNFFRGARREQEPIATLQAHVNYTLRPSLWLAVDATYYAGGRTTVNGVQNDDRQENTRLGLTFSLPIAKGNSLKLNWSEGVAERIGTKFTNFGATWQYSWFD
jgi:hypothetical protein